MKISSYLEQTLFFEQSPATDQYFEDRAPQLFESSGGTSFIKVDVQLPCHDPISNGCVWIHKIESESKADMLSDSQPPSPVDCNRFLKKDPPHYVEPARLQRYEVSDTEELAEVARASKDYFRMCFIQQRHSYSRLLISRDLFETLMSEFVILPRFREFVLLFGAKHGENEIGPPQLRSRWLVEGGNDAGSQDPAGFELAYGLRYAELNNRDPNRPWSIRQTAIYHKFKASSMASTWVLIAASRRAELSIDRYIKSCVDMAALNPFEIHLIVLDTALANWRPYIVSLTERITQQSDRVLVASIDENDPLQVLDVAERQRLKELEDQLADIVLVLNTTHDTIMSLLEKYREFDHNHYKSADENGRRGFDPIEYALEERQRDVRSSREKVETLHTKVRGTTDLLSSLLDLGNGNSLKQLAEEARKENLIIRQLTEKSMRDAGSVKILTIITLIYLPATVVSNFFSTQFVSQQEHDGGRSEVVVSSNAWLFAAISVPLTVVTLAVWWVWVRFQAHQASLPRRQRSLPPCKEVLTRRWSVPPRQKAEA